MWRAGPQNKGNSPSILCLAPINPGSTLNPIVNFPNLDINLVSWVTHDTTIGVGSIAFHAHARECGWMYVGMVISDCRTTSSHEWLCTSCSFDWASSGVQTALPVGGFSRSPPHLASQRTSSPSHSSATTQQTLGVVQDCLGEFTRENRRTTCDKK
jgi:hypothetical protein